MDLARLLLLAALGGAGYVAWRRGLIPGLPPGGDLLKLPGTTGTPIRLEFVSPVTVPASTWKLPPAGAPYAALLAVAEARHGIPENLLARLAWQESRFNPNAYNARSGATGMMQIVNVTGAGPGHGVAPIIDARGDRRRDPAAAIEFGGAYLAAMRRKYGNWSDALRAYNWGPGNVDRWIAAGRPAAGLPTETRNYVAQITADVGVA